MAEGQIDPLQLLQASMTNEVQSYATEAEERIKVAELASEHMQAEIADKPPVPSPMITNKSINKYYSDMTELLGPNKEVVTVIPKGKPFNWTTSPNVKAKVNDVTGETVLYVDKIQQPDRVTDPAKVHAAEIAAQTTKGQFDPDEALRKASTLSGDLLSDHVRDSLAQIESMRRQEMLRIRSQAAIESGYTSAAAALQRSHDLDKLNPMYARYQSPSNQTIQLQGLYNQALVGMHGLIQDLASTDAAIGRLEGAKQGFLKIEVVRTQREVAQANKEDALADVVPPIAIANYRSITGDKTTPDGKVRTIIAKDKDKVRQALYGVTEDTIWPTLANPDPQVKARALRLVLEKEKAAPNSTIPADATQSELTNWIKEIQDDPKKLLDGITNKDDRESWTKQTKLGTPKEIADAYQRLFSAKLPGYLQSKLDQKIRGDAKAWTGVTAAPGTPLRSAIDDVLKTSKDNKAPVGAVIETFMEKQYQGVDGKVLDFAAKTSMLEQAVRGHISGIPRNILFTHEFMQGLEERTISDIKNRAVKAKTRSIILQQDLSRQNTLGYGYLNPTNVF